MRGTIIAVGLVVLAMGVATAEPRTEPGVYVTMASPSIDGAERVAHVDTIRRGLTNHSALINRQIDVTINRMSLTYIRNEVEIVVELNFVLSTSGDQIVSFGNQTARLLIPRSQFNVNKLSALRGEVIENALGDLRRKLRTFAARTNV
jgi:hypothetical protein